MTSTELPRPTSYLGGGLFSLEMWGGATFDVSMRFLKEDPWERLDRLRKKIPNILFQMLLRGSNAVGYTNYPDNVVQKFVVKAAESGIDIFRVFDSLNWTKGMKVAMEAVRKSNGTICEAAICYTGDILDPKRDKYPLEYYVELAKELEQMGAHILAIKDMAGLLKPFAAEKLIKALKKEIGIPIHLHTHDTSSNGGAMLLMATQAGVDIVDAALSSVSGLTAQPNMNALLATLEGTIWDPLLDQDGLQKLANYWETVRTYYAPFESELRSGTAAGLPSRDSRRSVLQLQAAGRRARARSPLGRVQGDVPQGQRHVRRHHQGHPLVEDRRRHGDVPGEEQP